MTNLDTQAEDLTQDKVTDDKVTEEIGASTIQIYKLIIDEVHPVEETYNKGPIIDGESLSEKIHLFFGKHVENIFSSSGTRPARFNDPNSSILNSFKNILTITNDEISIENKNRITNILTKNTDTTNEESISFYYHTEILTKSLLDNINKKAKKSFLFVTLHCHHNIHGDLVALMKMEKVFGVQYSTSKKLKEQLDLLPDKSQALQKGALIFKNNLEQYPVENNYRENHEEDLFHTKIRDSQDTTISKYFMKGFLDSSIVYRDKENTTAAIQNIKVMLSPYLNIDRNDKQIVDFIKDNFSYGTQTTVKTLVDSVINNSGLINPILLEEDNQDNESISNQIYSKMLDLNPSSSDEFKIEFSAMDKFTFSDKKSDGKMFKLVVAKVSLEKNQVLLNVDVENDDIDDDMVLIAVSPDLISKEDLKFD